MKQTALITGASAGIGLAFAQIFAEKGYDLILVARRKDALMQLATSFPKTNVTVIASDLSVPNAAQEVFDQVKAAQLSVDVLVNNAGFGDYGFFHESNWQKQQEMMQLNMIALTQLTHLFLPEMIARKSGKILNVASTASFQPGPLMSVYFATKAFVLHFSEAIANELAGTGVSVTCLCPGATASEFQQVANLENSSMVKGRKLPTAYEVALYGYQALIKGKTVAIHGTLNYLMANSVRFSPRKMVVKLVRSIQKEV